MCIFFAIPSPSSAESWKSANFLYEPRRNSLKKEPQKPLGIFFSFEHGLVHGLNIKKCVNPQFLSYHTWVVVDLGVGSTPPGDHCWSAGWVVLLGDGNGSYL